MVAMVWVGSRLRLKGPSRYLIFIYISPLTSLGQRSRAYWALQPQKSATLSPQPGGKTTKFIRTDGGIWGGGNIYICKLRVQDLIIFTCSQIAELCMLHATYPVFFLLS